jgi:hypothetical protein
VKKAILNCCLSFIIALIYIPGFSQPRTCKLEISLLTGSPGTELYSTFGHSAIRVIDSINRQDLVFNYGTFDFDEKFYGRFVRGKLDYFLSVSTYDDFAIEFQVEQRRIIEQPLLLSCDEKVRLYNALQVNSSAQNRYYKYDFLFDNCATRIRDIVRKNTDTPVVYKNILPAEIPTFRDLIHVYLNSGGQFWSKLGIDILLGTHMDVKVSNEQAMFLPDYLIKGFDSAVIGNRKLVGEAKLILTNPAPEPVSTWLSPLMIFTALLVIVVLLQLSKSNIAFVILSVFDHIFFFFLGLLGVVILFMWFGTDHVVCRNNYNILWALPLHLPIVAVMSMKKKWVKKYFQGVLVLTALFAIAWWFLPQQLNTAIAPVLALIIVRSYYRSKFY